MTTIATPEYAALCDGAAVQMRRDGGVLALGDADRADFLHRMTTNNVQALTPGHACVTVLTSPTAKIIQVFTVLAREGDLLLLPARGATAALLRTLRGQIFFMDKVQVTDLGPQFVRLRVMGDQAGRVLAAAGYDVATLDDGSWHEDNGVVVLAQVGFDVPGFEILVPVAHTEAFISTLTGAGALLLDDDATYTARRIELGRPAPGAELTDEYNPLEAGLAWACADNKGCYTGQEIIARQVTYDKVTRTLVGLHSANLLAAGTAVSADGREVGAVTSAAVSPAQDAPLALAIVKRPHNLAGTMLNAGDQEARVVDLPFLREHGIKNP